MLRRVGVGSEDDLQEKVLSFHHALSWLELQPLDLITDACTCWALPKALLDFPEFYRAGSGLLSTCTQGTLKLDFELSV